MNKLWHLKTQRRLVSSSAASDVATDNLKDDEKLAGRRTELFFLRSIGERNYGGLEVSKERKHQVLEFFVWRRQKMLLLRDVPAGRQ